MVPWPTGRSGWEDQARALLRELEAPCRKIPVERIQWNAFRHTFGTLPAQAGVSLDKISAWMGNGPEVCRRHCAESVPPGRRDDETDRL